MNKTQHIGIVEYYAVKKKERDASDVLFGKIVIIYHLVEEFRGKVTAIHTMATDLSDLAPIRWDVFYHSLHLSHTSPHL